MNREIKTADVAHKIANANALLDYWEVESMDARKKAENIEKRLQKHVESYAQFLPFKKGDVLLSNGRMVRFDSLRKTEYKRRGYDDRLSREVIFECRCSEMYKGDYGGMKWGSPKEMTFCLKDLTEWTIYRDTPASLLEILAAD